MAGKIAWYLKDEPFNRDPYGRARKVIREVRASLTTEQREDWDSWSFLQDFESPNDKAKAIKHFAKVRNS
jgi:hypothetical protein